MNKSKTISSNNIKSTTTSGKINKAAAPWKQRLQPEDYQQLKSTFQTFDADGSGSIDPQQIIKALQQLGTQGRSPYVLSLIYALKDKNKQLNFEQFLDTVAGKVGETKTKDGLKRLFSLYDIDETGVVDFEKFKIIAKSIHEDMGDDELLEMMHSTHINNKTGTNQFVTFEQFYNIVTKFYK